MNTLLLRILALVQKKFFYVIILHKINYRVDSFSFKFIFQSFPVILLFQVFKIFAFGE